MWTEFAVTAFVTLLVVVDPVGLAPTFVSITQGVADAERRAIALRAAVIAAVILGATALGGSWLLDRLGIGLPAFRISGGILLFAVAFEMALGVRHARENRQAERAVGEQVRDIAAFPLAMPLMAGPGAITATLLLSGRGGNDVMLIATLLGAIVAIAGICALVFLAADRISGRIGNTGNIVLARVLGVLLAALAVQYVIDGVRTVLAGQAG